MISEGLAHAFSDTQVDLDSQTAPHRSVTTSLSACPRSRTIRAMAPPKGFPLGRPVGPRRQERAWPGFDWNSYSNLTERLDAMYAFYIQNVELDLCRYFDIVGAEEQKPFVGRAAPPRFRQVATAGPKPTNGSRTCPRADYWFVLRARTQDALRLAQRIQQLEDSWGPTASNHPLDSSLRLTYRGLNVKCTPSWRAHHPQLLKPTKPCSCSGVGIMATSSTLWLPSPGTTPLGIAWQLRAGWPEPIPTRFRGRS